LPKIKESDSYKPVSTRPTANASTAQPVEALANKHFSARLF